MMDEMMVTALAVKFLAFALAVLLAFVMLRVMDRLLRIDFKTVVENINENPLAASIYFGSRLLAVAIIGGAFLG